MAQRPDLLFWDDYSMGLDAGYRRLFLDYMREYLEREPRTVLLTSHVIQDLDDFVDEVIYLERGGRLLMTSLRDFRSSFRGYRLPGVPIGMEPQPGGIVKNVEVHAAYVDVFSFSGIAPCEISAPPSALSFFRPERTMRTRGEKPAWTEGQSNTAPVPRGFSCKQRITAREGEQYDEDTAGTRRQRGGNSAHSSGHARSGRASEASHSGRRPQRPAHGENRLSF